MPYYLQHYFMPDFNHKHLRPVAMADGNTSAHYLGYVQNVVAGQVLAELVYLDALPETAGCASTERTVSGNATPVNDVAGNIPLPVEEGYPSPEPSDGVAATEHDNYSAFYKNLRGIDHRFIYETPVFPQGPNCGRDPANPNRIIALINGYCFYHHGLITVKKLLNVRQDVSFHTGNILFTGDIVVHGDILPGFSVTGGNILVKGRIDGGKVRSKGSVAAHAGIKGAPTASIHAGGTIRLSYCEKAHIVTHGNLIVDGPCLHSDLYVGGSVIIKGRLQGGNLHANGLVCVKDQIGDVQGAATRISLGYNPLDFLHMRDLNALLEEQKQKLQYHTRNARKGALFAEEAAPFLELANRKIAVIKEMQHAFLRRFTADMRKARRNKVVAQGKVYPGTEISIGRAHAKIVDTQRDVFYCLHEDEIVHGYPALAKNYIFPSSADRDDACRPASPSGESREK